MFPSHRLFLFLMLVILAWNCRSVNEFPSTYRGDQIHFGQGGGIAGVLNYFVLLDDGRLYQRAFRDSTYALVDTWSDDFVAQMFSNYQTLHLDTVDHYQPGDQYYFIQYKTHDQPAHRIAWGRPGYHPAPNIVTYYNLLYKSTKSKS